MTAIIAESSKAHWELRGNTIRGVFRLISHYDHWTLIDGVLIGTDLTEPRTPLLFREYLTFEKRRDTFPPKTRTMVSSAIEPPLWTFVYTIAAELAPTILFGYEPQGPLPWY